jgi:hypothetical protein
VKFIGKIGRTKAVYGHFIERLENLQAWLEGVASLVQWIWCRGDCALDGRGCSTVGTEFPCDNICGTIRSRSFSIRERLSRVMGSDEKSSEVPESLEVGLTAFFKLVG